MDGSLHVSRQRQFIKCQVAFRLYGPGSPYTIKDKRVRKGRLLETLLATPFRTRKKKISGNKRVIERSDTMVRTGHAIAEQAQFKRRQVKEEDTIRQRHLLLNPNPRSVE
jgi:hypothetical protein